MLGNGHVLFGGAGTSRRPCASETPRLTLNPLPNRRIGPKLSDPPVKTLDGSAGSAGSLATRPLNWFARPSTKVHPCGMRDTLFVVDRRSEDLGKHDG